MIFLKTKCYRSNEWGGFEKQLIIVFILTKNVNKPNNNKRKFYNIGPKNNSITKKIQKIYIAYKWDINIIERIKKNSSTFKQTRNGLNSFF